MHKLSSRLFAETGFQWANVGAAVTAEGVVLIDCPVRPTDSKRWQDELRPLSPRGIRYLISTDYHGDHATGAAFVEDVTFIAPQLAYEELSQSKEKHLFIKQLFIDTLRDQGLGEEAETIARATIPLPKICFEESLALHFAPLTFEIRRLGGHTPACSVVYIPEEGVLFAGDVVIEERNPGMRDASLRQWLQALEWIEALPAVTIVPGHGEICGMEVVRRLHDTFSEMREIMRKLAGEGRSRADAAGFSAFEKFFWADTTRGSFWIRQRRETFKQGLERVYDEVKEEMKERG